MATDRECKHCKEVFTPMTGFIKFCSTKCRAEFETAKSNALWAKAEQQKPKPRKHRFGAL